MAIPFDYSGLKVESVESRSYYGLPKMRNERNEVRYYYNLLTPMFTNTYEMAAYLQLK